MTARSCAKSHEFHEGEKRLHGRFGVEWSSDDVHDIIQDTLPQQFRALLLRSHFLVMSVVNTRGNPVSSLLINPCAVAVSAFGFDAETRSRCMMQFSGALFSGDPLLEALSVGHARADEAQGDLEPDWPCEFAALLIDFATRRRVKISGRIEHRSVIPDEACASRFSVTVVVLVNECLGNCPKYMTQRQLRLADPENVDNPSCGAGLNSAEGLECRGPHWLSSTDTRPAAEILLSVESKELLQRCSTAFLATRHLLADSCERDVGVNHRGGSPGFIRVATRSPLADEMHSPDVFLLLLDYSGNRLFQSLGNVELEPQVSLSAVDFVTGSVLYAAGTATNVFGEDMSQWLPRCGVCGTTSLMVIKVSEARRLDRRLLLRCLSEDEVCSPYNPPTLYTAAEEAIRLVHQFGASTGVEGSAPLIATVTKVTEVIAGSVVRIDLELSREVLAWQPGDSVVLDCSSLVPFRSYQHMCDADPASLNDNMLRTWTIISTPSAPLASTLSICVRKKETGRVTPLLFTKRMRQQPRVSWAVRGFNRGAFSAPLSLAAPLPSIPTRWLWLAGGIGITPFVAVSSSLARGGVSSRPASIDMLFAHKPGDANLAGLLDSGITSWDKMTLETFVSKRLEKQDVVSKIVSHGGAELSVLHCFVCGPRSFEHEVVAWLIDVGIQRENIYVEQFSY